MSSISTFFLGNPVLKLLAAGGCFIHQSLDLCMWMALTYTMPFLDQGDQASIIGGVVDYIKELQQVKQSLEAKKQRKAYTEHVLSPRPPPSSYSPRLPLSPLHKSTPPLSPLLRSTPPLSPRLAVPISPARTPPTPGSPYKLRPLPPPISGSTYVSPA
uniref:BHLH domain-containing protein n=1 Tax=Aegilops tauschii subsp. strangulata TaxID=200361 RepID=A0A453S5P3_AEGTS